MEEEEQPRTLFEGEKPTVSGVSCSSSHETSKHNECPNEEEDLFGASDSFCNTMCTMMSKPDIEKIGKLQLETLTTYQEMNARFKEFNRYSFDRYEKLNLHFLNHTRLIVDMKKDLDIIFRRIRNLKTKLARQYGNAFAVTSANIQKLEEEIEADPEDYKEEKPQTVQQGSPPSDHPKNTSTYDNTRKGESTVDQPQGASASGVENNSVSQTNAIRKENQTVEESLNQEREVRRPVLRPQLSSSDENYSAEETDIRKDKQMVDRPLSQEAQKSFLRPQLSSSGDSYSSDQETDEDTQCVQNDSNPGTSNSENTSKVNYTTTLRPEISSSDESLEDDTDDEGEEESEANAEKCVSTPLSSEEEAMNTLLDGGKEN